MTEADKKKVIVFGVAITILILVILSLRGRSVAPGSTTIVNQSGGVTFGGVDFGSVQIPGLNISGGGYTIPTLPIFGPDALDLSALQPACCASCDTSVSYYTPSPAVPYDPWKAPVPVSVPAPEPAFLTPTRSSSGGNVSSVRYVTPSPSSWW